MWYHNYFFRYSVAITIILVIIWLVEQIDFFFRFWLQVLAALATPVLLAGFLYYLIRPILRWLESKIALPKTITILLLFLIFCSLIGLLGYFAGDLAKQQTKKIITDFPKLIHDAYEDVTEFVNLNNRSFTRKFQQKAIIYLERIIPTIINNLSTVFTTLTGLSTLLITVPFILFYFLRDDSKFVAGFIEWIPQNYRGEVNCTLKEADQTLLTYITGQILLALIMGALFYIGYLIIGIPYQLILALFVLLTSFIPTFGILIGVLPAVLIALASGWELVLKVLTVFVIINLLRKVIAPNLVGKRLQLHPLTIIFIFLIAGSMFGFTGVLIGVPVYAVSKELVGGIFRIYHIWKQSNASKTH